MAFSWSLGEWAYLGRTPAYDAVGPFLFIASRYAYLDERRRRSPVTARGMAGIWLGYRVDD
jgi:hypothetical protein